MLIYNLTHNLSDQNSTARLRRYLESFKVAYGYELYMVTDASGTVLLSFPEEVKRESVSKYAEEVIEVFKTGQVVLLDFHTHAVEAAEKFVLR